MRKVLLVTLMVAASFGGGAAINGPGLDWARDRFHDYLTELVGPAIGPAATGSAPRSDPQATAGKPAATTTDEDEEPAIPVTPVPELIVGDDDAPAIRHETERPAVARADEPIPAPAPLPLSVPEIPAAAATAPPADPAVKRTAIPGDPPSTANDWALVRRKMQELGVRQYWIEGQPGGLVRFRCVIPVAGKNAMAQHFEAEAADEFRAADAALRRVLLWRATETP